MPSPARRARVAKASRQQGVFEIAGVRVAPGERATVDLPVPRLYTHAEMDIPVHVVHGRREGPRLFVSAAVHGDEINGVEIIRQLMQSLDAHTLRGTVIAVPIVNVFGFINESRYLPDRRDLNRSFPGSSSGSLAGRLAHMFLREIVDGIEGVMELELVRVHRYGPHLVASLTIGVDGDQSVREGDAIADAVEAAVLAGIEHVSGVYVHYHPVGGPRPS